MTSGQATRRDRQTPALTIDALGKKCPIPIIMLAEQINDVPVNGIVAVLADDPAAFTDIPAWCRLKSHHHVGPATEASRAAAGSRSTCRAQH